MDNTLSERARPILPATETGELAVPLSSELLAVHAAVRSEKGLRGFVERSHIIDIDRRVSAAEPDSDIALTPFD